MSGKKFSIKARLRSFKFAFHGLIYLFRDEHNAWIHVLAALGAIIMGFVFKISGSEWIAVLIAIALVFVSELINSSIENLVDLIHPENDPRAGKIKDLAAAAVLVASIIAAVIGIIIFAPKILG